MRNKGYKKILALSLIGVMCLTACSPKVDTRSSKGSSQTSEASSEKDKGSKGNKEGASNTSFVSNGESANLGELKTKYEDKSLNNNGKVFSPMYNVGLDSSFTFHFKSKVDPYHAVTVHTSETCNLDSRMYIENNAYLTSDGGVDIVVNGTGTDREARLTSPVLESEDRIDNDVKNIWGNAQQYYISINYDLDSEIPVKLDKPIIIPFTLKKDVIAPMLNYEISQYGDYILKWEDTGADTYRIYQANNLFIQDDKDYVGKERCYYSLDYDFYIELPGDTTEFEIRTDGKYGSYNFGGDLTNNYYAVTAVKDGKESSFSNEVAPFEVLNLLPYDLSEDGSLKRFSSYEPYEVLPYTADVLMADQKTVKSYPVNYTLIDDQYAERLKKVTYKYEVIGTRLTGEADMIVGEDGVYEQEIKSPILLDYSMNSTIINPKSINNANTTIINGIDASDIDLTKTKEYDPHTEVLMSEEGIYDKLDIEISRMLTGGVHDETLIKLWEKPVVNYDDPRNTVEYIKEKYGDVFSDSVNNLDQYAVTADNVIETKMEDDERRIEEGNKISLSLDNGLIYEADFLEEEYLAINLINQEEMIRIDVLPTLMNTETLYDVVNKVKYQNPYFMGLENYAIMYGDDGGVYMVPEYTFPKEEAKRMQQEIKVESERVINEIISPNMTDREKVNAIWEYLENNTTYDHEALANAATHDYRYADKQYDVTFTTYGILCKKLGVCMSYAYVTDLLCKMCDINSLVLTGFATSGVGHAWNAIELDGNWYWFDATNTYDATLIQRFIYLTSSDFALNEVGYVLKDEFELDNRLSIPLSNSNTEDWYYSNGLVANNDEEFLKCIKPAYEKAVANGDISFAIRVNYKMNINDLEFASQCLDVLETCGVTGEQMSNVMGPIYTKPYAVIVINKDAFRKKLSESYQQ